MKKSNFIEEKEFELQWKESTPFHLPSQMIEDGEFIRPKYEPQHPLELEVKKYIKDKSEIQKGDVLMGCLLYTSPSPRDATLSRMPSSA